MKKYLLSLLTAIVVLGSVVAQQRAEWRFPKSASQEVATEFEKSHSYCASVGQTQAAIKFVKGAKSKSSPIFLLDGGLPCAAVCAEGDSWVFDMPLTEALPAGCAVDFYAMFGASKGAPKYYAVEYLNGKKWQPVTDTRQSVDGKKYNYQAKADGKTSVRVWNTVRLAKGAKAGSVLTFRIRVASPVKNVVSADGSKFRINGGVTGQYPQIICYDATVPSDTLRVLFVGNSYTYYNTYPELFKEIAWHEGHYADCTMFTVGGYTIGKHLANRNCLEAVDKGGYDYVFLQEQSVAPALIGSPDEEQTIATARRMVERIARTSPKATVLLEVTWGRKFGNNAINKAYVEKAARNPERFATYEAMQKYMTEGVEKTACAVGASLSPVGKAWQAVRSERPDIELYAADSHHPSYAGSYLSAAVAYVSIYKQPFSASAADCRLDSATAAYLRQVAERFLPQ